MCRLCYFRMDKNAPLQIYSPLTDLWVPYVIFFSNPSPIPPHRLCPLLPSQWTAGGALPRESSPRAASGPPRRGSSPRAVGGPPPRGSSPRAVGRPPMVAGGPPCAACRTCRRVIDEWWGRPRRRMEDGSLRQRAPWRCRVGRVPWPRPRLCQS
jgi:hypothetical protein